MKLTSDCKVIKESGLFNTDYYLRTYPDIRKADISPLTHFCEFGWRENRNPSDKFHTETYLNNHPELKELDINPLIYFIDHSEFILPSTRLSRFMIILKNIILHPSAMKKIIYEIRSTGFSNTYRHHMSHTLGNYKYYEEQHDYSSTIVHNDIKILSYYLPQFHPIPENDEWHGKGFTEWTKVKAANPLFQGHFQQHIPHEDIGYYLLDSPKTLKIQADMMKKSGVYGQVFYHYWFTGKLILEEPAKMLLENKNINMPFSFCWANENWTKKWDGNDDDILLEQVYSADDARKFIRYLIPFFKDQRYITIENRPVLYIYRPSSIPNVKEYIDIWKEECKEKGINEPYVVAVLTRGATTPNDFYMDAGVERILHDWTNGNVTEINNLLNTFQPVKGSVLPYNEVANFYGNQTDKKDFTYFRSISPVWDNTARYDNEAFILHSSTPELFQKWLEDLVTYTQKTLEEDRRFIIVNAWNEWAEGAHLEPDTYYGYSYLNAIGRVLSNIPYKDDLNDRR
jgi:hypothetical protein